MENFNCIVCGSPVYDTLFCCTECEHDFLSEFIFFDEAMDELKTMGLGAYVQDWA